MIAESPQWHLESYESLGEMLTESTVSVLIVPGQGPLKPVLLREELTPEEAAQWDAFKAKKDKYAFAEPKFYVIESETYLSELDAIKRSGKPTDNIAQEITAKRIEWQNTSRFTGNRWERMNAIAAGVLLLSGITEKVVFTGGVSNLPIRHDKSGDTSLSKALHDSLISEAEVMRNLVVSQFGRRLFHKEHPIEELTKSYNELGADTNVYPFETYLNDAYEEYLKMELSQKISVETHSVNTLQNFSFSLNTHPDMQDVGVLAANFQVQRALVLARLFEIPLAQNPGHDVQYTLLKRAEMRNNTIYARMMKYLGDLEQNEDLRNRLKTEKRWINAHTDPKYAVGFNIGYIFDLQDLSRVQHILDKMREPDWITYAREVFEKAGLSFDTISELDLQRLEATQPETIEQIKGALSIFKKEVSGPTGPREGYVPPVVETLADSDIAFLLPHASIDS